MPPPLPSLQEIFQAISAHYGPIHWWPGETPFEVMVGAVLTQNTAWTNVEKVLSNLKKHGLLSLSAMSSADERVLAQLIRSSGYYNQKARKLKDLMTLIVGEYGGSIVRMRSVETAQLRRQLLDVKGIGPETADSILLYALDKPILVVDAYTKRIFGRHYYFEESLDYAGAQKYFTDRLPQDVSLYNEFHGLIVHLGKDFCRKNPRCSGCPLDRFPHKRFHAAGS